MNEPLTREKGSDALAQFRGVFRESLIRHGAGRLALSYLLRFTDNLISPKRI